MDWNGLYLVALGLIVGGYGLYASRTPNELQRNRRSANLIPNLTSRLSGRAKVFLLVYLLFGLFFAVAGIYTVLAGHPI